jgi:hypothetical protein
MSFGCNFAGYKILRENCLIQLELSSGQEADGNYALPGERSWFIILQVKVMDEKISELSRMRITAVFLGSSLSSPNIGEIIVAQAELDSLIDEFQASYADFVTNAEIETAKKDVELFIKLIDSTARQCRMKSGGKTG